MVVDICPDGKASILIQIEPAISIGRRPLRQESLFRKDIPFLVVQVLHTVGNEGAITVFIEPAHRFIQLSRRLFLLICRKHFGKGGALHISEKGKPGEDDRIIFGYLSPPGKLIF